ncbi:MAG: CpsD/CapB family tyrosine-protein kinase [Candidatus Eisenbacteria bacterium]
MRESKDRVWIRPEGESIGPTVEATRQIPLSVFDGDSPVSTEFQRLHARLSKLNAGRKTSSLLVTSARRGEGKTTTSAFLAYTAALHSDRRVVVVDCDLRKPRLHELFGIGQRLGLVDALANLLPLKSVIKDTELDNLKVITSGRSIGVPSALFESYVFREMLGELRANFDLVILDSAPILPVSDAFLISEHCDGILLVVMAGKTPVEVLARARDLLGENGSKILGAVINNAEEVLPYYYDYDYYGYKGEKGAAKGAKNQS